MIFAVRNGAPNARISNKNAPWRDFWRRSEVRCAFAAKTAPVAVFVRKTRNVKPLDKCKMFRQLEIILIAQAPARHAVLINRFAISNRMRLALLNHWGMR